MTTAPRRRLGKGLGALLGETAVGSGRGAPGLAEVAVAHIIPNRFQPRVRFDDESIAELAESIARQGVLQPLIVIPRDGGGYELVSGERRWRAAQRAGLATVPVIVRDLGERDLLEIALVENLQREDLDPIEEGLGFRRLRDEFGMTQAELGAAVGKSRPAIANALRLLDLPDAVQAQVRSGALSAGHGRALLGLSDARGVRELAAEAAEKGLSVRQVERLVRRANAGPADGGPRSRRGRDHARAQVEEELQRALGTRVAIHASPRGRGRIEIAFYSHDDLERLIEMLRAGAR